MIFVTEAFGDSSMIFKSAVDWWFYAIIGISILLGIISLWPIVQIGDSGSIALGVGTSLLTFGLPIWLLLSTEYRIDSNTLFIRSGPFRWTVPIQEIHNIEPSRSVLSSPALSLDRFKITYGSDKQVLVSPKRRDQFIQALGHERQE